MLEGDTMTKTKWFKRETPPARPGLYECAVRLCGLQRGLIVWGLLEWDGKGFLVPCPMVVRQWRGLRHKPSNAKSQATDAALSRQVACTDGLGAAVLSAPTFGNRDD